MVGPVEALGALALSTAAICLMAGATNAVCSIAGTEEPEAKPAPKTPDADPVIKVVQEEAPEPGSAWADRVLAAQRAWETAAQPQKPAQDPKPDSAPSPPQSSTPRNNGSRPPMEPSDAFYRWINSALALTGDANDTAALDDYIISYKKYCASVGARELGGEEFMGLLSKEVASRQCALGMDGGIVGGRLIC